MSLISRSITIGNDHRLKIAVASDLHGSDPSLPLKLLKQEKPDIIVCPGDLFEMRDGLSEEQKARINEKGFEFLFGASSLAPTFFSRGNHDAFPTERDKERIAQTGAVFLDGFCVFSHGIWIGGLGSGGSNRYLKITNDPSDVSFLGSFAGKSGFKLLLCHHPEYYEKFVKKLPIDLTVSGHAHGGQWVIFGQPIFAPGQGMFPKYVSGSYDGGRLVVSRGIGGLTRIPRIRDPEEIVFITI